MSKKQTGNILVSVIGISALIASINSYCPDSQICNCTSESIKCICLQHEDITLLEDEKFTGKEIIIKECGKIELMKLSLNSLHVELIHISDLQELYVEPNAFDGSHIKNFHIYNISEFRLESYGLGNIKNITNLIISNVTFENLSPGILGDTEAQNVAIKNSHIGTITSRALHMQNIESFVMENNVINAFDYNAIAITYIKKFNFTRNLVISTSFGSISLASAEEVDFGYCSFRQIHSSMIITKDIDVFSFHDSHIENCGEKAFWSIQVNKQIRFVNNQILLANDDSLLPNLGPNVVNLSKIVIDNNSFVCDCELEWLLVTNNPSYDFIKEKSVCHDPPYLASLTLSQLALSLNNVGTCVSIEALTTTTSTSVPIKTPTTVTITIPKTVPIMTEGKFSSQTPITSSNVKGLYLNTGSSPFKIITVAPTQSEVKAKYRSQDSSGNIYTCSSLLLSSLFFLTIWCL